MKAADVVLDGEYLTTIRDKVVRVRVESIECGNQNPRGRRTTRYTVVNVRTGGRYVLRSAAKLQDPTAPPRIKQPLPHEVAVVGVPERQRRLEEMLDDIKRMLSIAKEDASLSDVFSEIVSQVKVKPKRKRARYAKGHREDKQGDPSSPRSDSVHQIDAGLVRPDCPAGTDQGVDAQCHRQSTE